jgi:hypothetical protein
MCTWNSDKLKDIAAFKESGQLRKYQQATKKEALFASKNQKANLKQAREILAKDEPYKAAELGCPAHRNKEKHGDEEEAVSSIHCAAMSMLRASFITASAQASLDPGFDHSPPAAAPPATHTPPAPLAATLPAIAANVAPIRATSGVFHARRISQASDSDFSEEAEDCMED